MSQIKHDALDAQHRATRTKDTDMNQDKTPWQEQLREADRIAILLREAEIREITAESMRLKPEPFEIIDDSKDINK